MSQIIYGNQLSAELKAEMKQRVETLVAQGHRPPCLAVILVGDDPASQSYVKGKEKACVEVGFNSQMYTLSGNTSQKELEDTIRKCNNDQNVDGILIQLPLPKGLDENQAILCMSPDKDVDGLHPINVGRFHLGLPSFVPCTPSGVMEILKKMNCDPAGKHAVVIGRSKLVGTPISRLLINANATVTICHSYTENLSEITKQADILIAAVGKAKMIRKEHVKEGAYVIDVGVNRGEDEKLCGDVDFDEVVDYVEAITPVPRGVGPMTITMLLKNTLKAYEDKL